MDEQGGEEVLYDPKGKGETDEVPSQTDDEGLETPIAPTSGDMIHD